MIIRTWSSLRCCEDDAVSTLLVDHSTKGLAVFFAVLTALSLGVLAFFAQRLESAFLLTMGAVCLVMLLPALYFARKREDAVLVQYDKQTGQLAFAAGFSLAIQKIAQIIIEIHREDEVGSMTMYCEDREQNRTEFASINSSAYHALSEMENYFTALPLRCHRVSA